MENLVAVVVHGKEEQELRGAQEEGVEVGGARDEGSRAKAVREWRTAGPPRYGAPGARWRVRVRGVLSASVCGRAARLPVVSFNRRGETEEEGGQG